jgi:hypothetical protein
MPARMTRSGRSDFLMSDLKEFNEASCITSSTIKKSTSALRQKIANTNKPKEIRHQTS